MGSPWTATRMLYAICVVLFAGIRCRCVLVSSPNRLLSDPRWSGSLCLAHFMELYGITYWIFSAHQCILAVSLHCNDIAIIGRAHWVHIFGFYTLPVCEFHTVETKQSRRKMQTYSGILGGFLREACNLERRLDRTAAHPVVAYHTKCVGLCVQIKRLEPLKRATPEASYDTLWKAPLNSELKWPSLSLSVHSKC